MHLFRPKVTHHFLGGRRVPSSTPGATPATVEARKWYVRVPGRRSPVPLSANKETAKRMAARLLAEAELGSVGDGSPGHRAARARPLAEHLEAFLAAVRDRRTGKRSRPPSAKHLAEVGRVLGHALDLSGWRLPGDVRLDEMRGLVRDLGEDDDAPEVAEGAYTLAEVCRLAERCEDTVLRQVRRLGLPFEGRHPNRRYPAASVRALLARQPARRGLGARMLREYALQARRFARWLARECGWPRSPLEDLECPPGDDHRHRRRPLTPDEAGRLLDAAGRSARSHRGLGGPDRRALYLCALATGLRRGELASLTPASFDLGGAPLVRLAADASKNGRGAAQPLPPDAAAELAGWLRGKGAGAPVWPGSWADSASAMLFRDLEDAGVPYRTEDADGPLYLDFHALRHTYVSLLDRAGVSLKQAMQLARHSDPRLTARVYGRAGLEELGRAVARVGLPGVGTGGEGR